MKDIYRILNEELELALYEDEVPVACLIKKENKIIASDHNRRIKKKDPMAHAEILCIKKTAEKLKTWNLSDCELYVTLEPCKMCKEIINESRIKRVYYFIKSNKIMNDNVEYIKIDRSSVNKQFESKIKNFFKNKR